MNKKLIDLGLEFNFEAEMEDDYRTRVNTDATNKISTNRDIQTPRDSHGEFISPLNSKEKNELV